jgi:protein-S-isoprenylcysteine O-methyltransferase Ste14
MTEKENYFTLRVILGVFFLIFMVPLLPLLISGRWNWWEAWVYAFVYILTFVVSRALAARHNPGILAERSKIMAQSDTQSWDKVLVPLVMLGGVLLPLVVGLEARYGQQPAFSLTVRLVALLVFIGSMVWASLALIENSYFSGTVRLQSERGHKVVSSGPYAVMRHPGYIGALLSYLAVPILLESWWGFAPVVILWVVLVVRTRLEDRFLQDNLPGYKDYASRVRYRLLPGVW